MTLPPRIGPQIPRQIPRQITRLARAAAAALCMGAGAAAASAQAAAESQQESEPFAPEPGAELTVYLATFGPGDSVWEKFGHNAIWIHDATTRSTTSYNYGIFDFDQPGFIARLVAGSMLYSMGVRSADEELAAYTYYNRQVTTQRLNLTNEQKHQLREFLEWNWLPANRDYLYDYFRDNCSTRVRDALDLVLGGRIRAALDTIATDGTYRSHSLRLTAGSIPTYSGLLLGLGKPTDVPLSAWEEAFVPMRLMDRLRGIEVTDAAGRAVPLVADEEVLFRARRDPPPDSPPRRTVAYLIAGMLLAAGLLALAGAGDRPMAVLALAASISFWGVLTGFFGSLLMGLWLFTDHTAAYPNLNLLQVSPLGLLLALVGPLVVVRRHRSPGATPAVPYGGVPAVRDRVALTVAAAIVALSLIGLVLRLLPVLHQENGGIIAFALPVHLAVLGCLYWIGGRRQGAVPRREVVAPTLP